MQLRVAGDIVAKDGFGSLYKGLSAGLLRQATYTTARMGIFEELKGVLKERNGTNVSFSFTSSTSTQLALTLPTLNDVLVLGNQSISLLRICYVLPI